MMAAQYSRRVKRAALLLAMSVLVIGGVAAVQAVAFDPYANDDPDGHFLKHEQVFTSGSTLRIHNPNGYIVVRSWDRDYLMVKAVKHLESGASPLGWLSGPELESGHDIEGLFNDIRLSVRATDGGVDVQTHLPAALPERLARVQYDVMVPRNCNLDLETDNGHITVMDIRGDVEAFSDNGKVTLSNVYGSAWARTSNGNVLCKRVSGQITARAENGSILIQHHDRLPLSQIDCTTLNGKIELELQGIDDFSIDARTDNGRVITDFPNELDTQTVSMDHVFGRLGTGGPAVRLKTASGSIRIANG